WRVLRDFACGNYTTGSWSSCAVWAGSSGSRGRAPPNVLRRQRPGYKKESAMSTTPQKRALNNYRKRLSQRGMARFEVLGRDADRELVRSVARRLAGDGPDSARIRATVRSAISEERPKKGGILNALRRW